MAQTVEDALRAASFYTDDNDYVMLKLPPGGITAAAGIIAQISMAFSALIVDKDEVTLIIFAEAVEDFNERLHNYEVSQARYRLITLDVVLEPQLTGFMARIASALAEAGVTIMPFAAYQRDHLLVPTQQFDTAMNTLKKLQTEINP